MAERKKKSCMACLVTLFLLGLIGTMILGAIGALAYVNREKLGIPSLEEMQEQLDEAVENAESGKGFSGNAGKLKKANAQDLSEAMKRDDVLVLVSYSADWFEPCRLMKPDLDRLAWKYGDKVVILDIHVDEEQELAKREKVETIPDFRLMYQGKELARAEGYLPFSVLEAMVIQNEMALEGSRSRALVMPDGGVIEPVGKKFVPEGFSKTMPTGEAKK